MFLASFLPFFDQSAFYGECDRPPFREGSGSTPCLDERERSRPSAVGKRCTSGSVDANLPFTGGDGECELVALSSGEYDVLRQHSRKTLWFCMVFCDRRKRAAACIADPQREGALTVA